MSLCQASKECPRRKLIEAQGVLNNTPYRRRITYYTFNGRGKKRIDYILTRQRDRKFVRNVTVHPQPSLLPISDNIVSAPVKLLGHFAQNCWLRASAKPPVDRRRLVTDPQLRQEVATAVGRHLRANPPGDSSVDDAEAAFAAAIMRTAELVIPSQERRRPGRGWSGDARIEAELQAATDAMHTAFFERFNEEPAILAELVHLKEPPTSMGPEPAMDYVRRAVWGMLYADDTCIVSRSPQGLAKMMEVIVEVCQAFALTVSAKKSETMCMPPPRTSRTMVRLEAAGQIYKQVQSFTYLGGAVTETPDMSVEIARRTRACWMRIRRYSRELYGQPKVALSLKTRMVKAEVFEPFCMDAVRGPSARNTTSNFVPYTTGSCFASSGRSARDQTTG